MSKTYSTKRALVAILMMVTAFNSTLPSPARTSNEIASLSEEHDASYVSSLEKAARTESDKESIQTKTTPDTPPVAAPQEAQQQSVSTVSAHESANSDQPKQIGLKVKHESPENPPADQTGVAPAQTNRVDDSKPSNTDGTSTSGPSSLERIRSINLSSSCNESTETPNNSSLPVDIDRIPLAALPPNPTGPVEFPEVLVVDSDVEKAKEEESKETASWSDVVSEDGETRILAGARFPVVIVSSHTSRTCRVGDRVEARLKSEIRIGDRVIAGKHARVLGHVTSAHKARRLLKAEVSPKRWMRANGAIGIQFDEIITESGEHIPLIAAPARMARIINNKAEGRVLGINHKGEVASPLSIQLKHQGIHMAIRAGASAGGVFSMGAVPVIFGLIGALHPSFAFMHPVGKNVPHRRLKGFGMGFLSGLPGGFVLADFFIKGVEAAIKPGDEFLVEFKQDFTGEPATAAQLLPQENVKVTGEVVRSKKKKSSKKRAPEVVSPRKAAASAER